MFFFWFFLGFLMMPPEVRSSEMPLDRCFGLRHCLRRQNGNELSGYTMQTSETTI
jgi:hypothetical protein